MFVDLFDFDYFVCFFVSDVVVLNMMVVVSVSVIVGIVLSSMRLVVD